MRGPWWKVLKKLMQGLAFAAFYLRELVRANFRVASYVIRPRRQLKPGVIAIPLDVKSDLELISLANLITMTPGTLSIDISTDRRVLYIHAMYVDDAERLRHAVKGGLERKVIELFS